ncbi:hypothetical protein [Streptomyces sp. SPB074]|uniref:hypothetical protein n=1 Tax=Streptomyces sp. (strain SPB074) TaxID=465543 RepID=UPI00017FE941|nr:hypothetical protein [Streptomyces sp. SPB074]
MPKSVPVSCVEHEVPFRRRLGGAEAAVIIVIFTLAAALPALAGMPVTIVLQVLAGAGLIAVIVVSLGANAPRPWFRMGAKALLSTLA